MKAVETLPFLTLPLMRLWLLCETLHMCSTSRAATIVSVLKVTTTNNKETAVSCGGEDRVIE